MKLGLTKKAFRRLEPDDGKLSSPVLRGRRERQRSFCYPTLILVISILGFNRISASEELSLKRLVEKVEQSALLEKKSVDSLIAEAAKVTTFAENQCKENQSTQNCPILGCTSMMASKKPSEKTSPLLEGNKPLIFVSSSMPIESLKRLAYQAVQYGAILVIRGMVKDNMLETAKLVDQIDHPLEIDPKLFEQFKIQKVPVFLINHATSWHKVSGNVELNFALEHCSKPLLAQQERVQP